MREGGFAVKELINDEPKGPDVGLGAIDIVDIAFRRHVERRPNINVLE